MTQHWLVLKTDPNKEFTVAQALSALGHEVWVPTYVATAYERFTAGPGITLRRKKAIERPLMPSVVLFSPCTWNVGTWLARHVRDVWSDGNGNYLKVRQAEVDCFRARVEEVNAAEIERIRRSWTAKRKPRKTVKLDPNLADELKAMIFGQREQEAA